MKKPFLVLFVLLAGMAGLSAAPSRQSGADAAPQMAQNNDAAFTQATELICLWADQYQKGLLTGDEFKNLVAGRITVLHMRQQVSDGGMRSLAEKTRAKVDRLLLLWELRLGIRQIRICK
jgi:hypothetical protein